jgi:hypothetical protein
MMIDIHMKERLYMTRKSNSQYFLKQQQQQQDVMREEGARCKRFPFSTEGATQHRTLRHIQPTSTSPSPSPSQCITHQKVDLILNFTNGNFLFLFSCCSFLLLLFAQPSPLSLFFRQELMQA